MLVCTITRQGFNKLSGIQPTKFAPHMHLALHATPIESKWPWLSSSRSFSQFWLLSPGCNQSGLNSHQICIFSQHVLKVGDLRLQGHLASFNFVFGTFKPVSAISHQGFNQTRPIKFTPTYNASSIAFKTYWKWVTLTFILQRIFWMFKYGPRSGSLNLTLKVCFCHITDIMKYWVLRAEGTDALVISVIDNCNHTMIYSVYTVDFIVT